MAEHQPSKLRVAGSNPVSRSKEVFWMVWKAHVAQSVERVLGKDEVSSSILLVGSRPGIAIKKGGKRVNRKTHS